MSVAPRHPSAKRMYDAAVTSRRRVERAAGDEPSQRLVSRGEGAPDARRDDGPEHEPAAVVPRHRDVEAVPDERAARVRLELVHVDEALVGPVDQLLGEPARRLPRHVAESEDDGEEAGEPLLEPGRAPGPDVPVVVEEPERRRVGMEDGETRRARVEGENALDRRLDDLLEAELHRVREGTSASRRASAGDTSRDGRTSGTGSARSCGRRDPGATVARSARARGVPSRA